jgi:methionyl-tRNA formyltransferase
MSLKIVFFGTAELACASLNALARETSFELLAVVTQPDKQRGRDLKLLPPAVKAAAMELGLPVLQPKRARDEAFLSEIRSLAPNLAVVVAYGQILPQALLDIPDYGCVNVHTSLLPKHRGAAPIQWAILDGDPESGVTIMKMDAGLDTGPILAQCRTAIDKNDTGQSLHDRLARLGAELLVKTIPDYVARRIQPQTQPAGASYARKIEKVDGLIDWSKPADVIDRQIRAFTPWPGAFTFLGSPEKRSMLKIILAEPQTRSGATSGAVLEADRHGILVACGAGSLLITTLQPEGRKRMTAQEYLSGHALQPGQAFTR